MKYKILESNGVEIENIDGAAFNNFTAGGKSGIVAGVLNECNLITVNNVVTVSTGLLLIQGIRVKIIENIDFSLLGTPVANTTYYIIAKVVLNNGVITFDMFITTDQTRVQDNLYKNNQGTYELEIGRFVHSTMAGLIAKLQKTAELLKQDGGNGGGSGLTEEEKAKVDKLVIDGDGTKFLADNGEYKEVENGTQVEANPTEEATEQLLTIKIGEKTYFIPVGGSNLDIQINGTSIVENGVAKIPFATRNIVGLMSPGTGLQVNATGLVSVLPAYNDENITKRLNSRVFTFDKLDIALKIGLTTNTTELTDEEKASAQAWLGISGGTQLYKHTVLSETNSDNSQINITAISTSSTPFSSLSDMMDALDEQGLISTLWYWKFDGASTPIARWSFSKFVDGTSGRGCITLDASGGEQSITMVNEDYTLPEYAPIPLQGE